MTTAVFMVFILLFGLVIGSFLNVCIYRIPEKQSIVTGRSHCRSCLRVLKWYELIPVASYLRKDSTGCCLRKNRILSRSVHITIH